MNDKYIFLYGSQIYEIPERMRGALTRYVKDKILPGDFLQAVISNDLSGATGRADEENMAQLPAYVNYFYNHAPSTCWGSKKKMDEWVKK
jgi:hypothetical protein